MQNVTLKSVIFYHVFPVVKISDVTRQLLHGAVEEEVLLG